MANKCAGIRRAKKKMGRREKKMAQKKRKKTDDGMVTYMTGQLIEKKTGQNIESRKQKRTKQRTG
jgi:hypothetical protein